jgi:putative phosphoesterase
MKIGIISDTHDDLENVHKAIVLFNDEDTNYVIHAGDYVFPGVVREFQNLGAKFIGVLGNNDGERSLLLKSFLDIEGELRGELGEIDLDRLKFGIYHGTSKEIKEMLVNSGRYDILVCGHTHIRESTLALNGTGKNNKKTLVLNPGTAHKKVASKSGAFEESGVIIFDTQTKEYRFVDL